MNYSIYFDESNKLDQSYGRYSYYGAFGADTETITNIVRSIDKVNYNLGSRNEMHFVNYTSDTNFEKYFRSLCHVIAEEVSVNIMIVNNEDAAKISEKMNVTMIDLRELFYVKIPERLFYGMTRTLENTARVNIAIDKNDEYEKLELPRKLEEQMNAHSAYRNKGYKIDAVQQLDSMESIPLQVIDTFMGMIVYIMESQFKYTTSTTDNITMKVKSDLIYRFLIHNDNVELFQNKINLYKWEGNREEVVELNVSDYLSQFLIDKTQYDIEEMNRLEKLRTNKPDSSTKYLRKKMGYSNRELKTIQGYLDELDGKGRNSYFEL